jgi:hypothetical protein
MKTENESLNNILSNSQHLEKCWVAVRDNNIIMKISMRVPKDVDFELFRQRALLTLKTLGDVKTGDIYRYNNEIYFLARPNKHENRSKKIKSKPIQPIKLNMSY